MSKQSKNFEMDYWSNGQRYYVVEGEKFPSVTTYLNILDKPALIPWASKLAEKTTILAFETALEDYKNGLISGDTEKEVFIAAILERAKSYIPVEKAHEKELERAANIGTDAHKLIEHHLKRMMKLTKDKYPEPKHAESFNAFEAAKLWIKEVQLKPIKIETTVACAKYEYAGTLDCYGYVNGKLTILDWKTGKRIYPESYMQNAAYRYAANLVGMPSEQGMIVHIPKNSESDPFYSETVPEPMAQHFRGFLAAIVAWKWHRDMAVLSQQKRKPTVKRVKNLAKTLEKIEAA